MKKINIFKAIVFASTLGMALSAWGGDFTVPYTNVKTSKEEIIFDFGTININNWSQLKSYANQFLKEGSANASFKASLSDWVPYHYNSNLYIEKDYLYVTDYTNISNLGKSHNYKIFKIDDNIKHLGFIVTASDGTGGNNPINIIKNQNNIIFPLPGFSNTDTVKVHMNNNGRIETYKMETVYRIDAELFISLVFIPANDIKAGLTPINKTKIGELSLAKAGETSKTFEKIIHEIYIQGKINVTLPSCTITNPNQSINLGTVSKSQIENNNNIYGKSGLIEVKCDRSDNIQKINARFYDVNYPDNQGTDILKLSCASGTQAQGVGIKVQMQQGGGNSGTPETSTNIQLGEKSALQKIDPTSGFLFSTIDPTFTDPTLINIASSSNAGNLTSEFIIKAKYVKDARAGATITPGCADAKLGIMFNYE